MVKCTPINVLYHNSRNSTSGVGDYCFHVRLQYYAHMQYNHCIATKFGRELNLTVWRSIFVTAKLKILTCIILYCMAILYQTANLK